MYRYLGFIAILALSACVATQKDNGYVMNEKALAYVREGESSRQDVLRALGTPSSTTQFEVERWHYISKKSEVKGVLDPELKEQMIVSVEFDPSGVVSKVEKRSADDRREVKLVERETGTEGHSIGVMEQLLGNFGKFNKPRDRVGNVSNSGP